MIKKYQIQRDDLIKSNLSIVIMKLSLDKIVNDLIMTGEFILDCDEILKEIEYIPGPLVGEVKCVHYTEIKIIYTNQTKEY